MKRYEKYGNYDLEPMTQIASGTTAPVVLGYEEIFKRIQQDHPSKVILCDLYPGVNEQEILDGCIHCCPDVIVKTSDCLYSEEELQDIFKDNLSEDRVFGFLSHKRIDACFDPKKVEKAREVIKKSLSQGLSVLVIGVGAYVLYPQGVLIYFDMTRWEIQLRYRAGEPNWLWDNSNAPILEKYKRGFFIEWRIADKHKLSLLDKIDYLIDTNISNQPKMIEGNLFRQSLKEVSTKPFRMQPYFDPGVWGGQWMKDVFGLNPEKENYAWSFDGVPEENSINLQYENGYIQVPAINLVLHKPNQLLGEKVHARFGREFPIRFDLLDTMEGQNLSLQVHPLTEYIQENFGMHYTQDESYYILDAAPDTYVYIGLKEGVDPNHMAAELRLAEQGTKEFPAENFVNKVPVKKHDHILIPAGTVHCSGADTMVLEISATPYIFTFKLWDWGRVGLDGLPRPIHVDHGVKNIQWNRTTSWVKDNLIDQEVLIAKDGDSSFVKTGLHEREFIETVRITTSSQVDVSMDGSVQVVNLVEGSKACIESVDEGFTPFEIHYAETCIIPAAVGSYRLVSDGELVSLITAKVRG